MYQRGLSVLSCEQITIHKIKNRTKQSMPDCVETETLEQVLQQSLFHLLHDSRDSASSAEGNGPGTVLQGLLLIPP